MLSFLSLFAADLNFSQPGCSGISTYGDLFGVNLAGMRSSESCMEVHEISVVFAGFGVLVLLLLIQYHVTVWRHRRKVMVEEVQAVSLVRTNAIEHAINTCMNYVMFVWAVLFTKAFQGVHCISRGRLVLAVDLSMVFYAT